MVRMEPDWSGWLQRIGDFEPVHPISGRAEESASKHVITADGYNDHHRLGINLTIRQVSCGALRYQRPASLRRQSGLNACDDIRQRDPTSRAAILAWPDRRYIAGISIFDGPCRY